jgi:hypothetical protein
VRYFSALRGIQQAVPVGIFTQLADDFAHTGSDDTVALGSRFHFYNSRIFGHAVGGGRF